MDGKLIDPYGRVIQSLRISITKRCNLNCIYCHAEGDKGNSKFEMPPELIRNIVSTATGFGVDKVKFSGGEPLVRNDFEDILAILPELKNVSATTNGTLLAKRAASLAESGLDRINVSLPSLIHDNYKKVTGKNMLNRVLDGVHAAIDAGLTPVKLNVVMLRGINDSEIEDMMGFVSENKSNLILQLIELMDFGTNPEYRMDIGAVEKMLETRAERIAVRDMHRRKKYFIRGVEVELVRPMDNSVFCANCNRLRVTSDGKLKPCLLRNDDLVDASHASPDEMPDLFRHAVNRRRPFFKVAALSL